MKPFVGGRVKKWKAAEEKMIREGKRKVEADLEADHENYVKSASGDVTFHDTAAEH
jgi:hypothetical protein